MRTVIFTGIIVMALLLNAVPSSAGSLFPTYAIGIGLDVSSGAFGSGTTSSYVTAPVIIDWFPSELLDLELTVPLLYKRTSGAGRGSRGMLGGDYGLGDITLTSGYTLLMDSPTSPQLRPTLYAKFPTADESEGFGTGQFDFGAGIVVSKWLGNWQPFTELRYVVQGGPHDKNGANNFMTADVGASYAWNGRLVTSAYARLGSSQFDGMAAPLEARLKTTWRFDERTYTEGYALKGFSDGSPDYGGGVSLFLEF